MGLSWTNEEYIKDFNTQKIIGIIRYYANGDQTAVDFKTRKVLGFYKAALNQTTDFFGRVLSIGNSIHSLFYK